MNFFISERNKKGVIGLILLCIFIVFIPRITASFWNTEIRSITKEALALKKTQKSFNWKKNSYNRNFYSSKKSKFNVPKSKFDPNLYQEKDWLYLGLSPKQVNVVMKFTERGVYSTEDFSKIFVIPETLFLLIKDSLVFPERPSKFNTNKTLPVFVAVDINIATFEDLEKLPGIGEYMANQIIKYRDHLGGYVSKEQLLEVYNMRPELFDQFEAKIQIQQKAKRLNINTITFEELNAHPYISKALANSLVKMRIQKGTYKDLEEIKESKLMNEELFDKLKPYLTL